MRVWRREEIRPWHVLGAVLGQAWPLLAFLGALVVAAWLWSSRGGDPFVVELFWSLFLVAAIGLVGAFALHETAHVMALSRVATVTQIAMEHTWLRVSVAPVGVLTPGQTAGVALVGPLSCTAVGGVLLVLAPQSSLGWWFLAHAVFLLPVFGDGRALVRAARAARAAGSAKQVPSVRTEAPATHAGP